MANKPLTVITCQTVPICYNGFVASALFFRALPLMASRHAVLLTPSLFLRPIQPLSCSQLTRETPLIPVFVFKTLRTLSFSVAGKSCVCHSYENGRVCTNNSHSGTLRRVLANLPLDYFDRGASRFFRSAHFAFSATGVCPDPVEALNPSFPFDFQLSTLNSRPPRSLSPFFSNFCGLFCTQQKVNSFVFMEFRTLCTKHPGWRALLPRVLELPLSSAVHGLRDTTHNSFQVEDSPSGNSIGSAGGASAMASSSG